MFQWDINYLVSKYNVEAKVDINLILINQEDQVVMTNFSAEDMNLHRMEFNRIAAKNAWVTMISELSTAIILYTGKTKTLTVAVYTEVVRGNYGTAAALSTILTALTVVSLLVFNRFNKGKDLSL